MLLLAFLPPTTSKHVASLSSSRPYSWRWCVGRWKSATRRSAVVRFSSLHSDSFWSSSGLFPKTSLREIHHKFTVNESAFCVFFRVDVKSLCALTQTVWSEPGSLPSPGSFPRRCSNFTHKHKKCYDTNNQRMFHAVMRS